MVRSVSLVRGYLLSVYLLTFVPSMPGQATDTWPALSKEDLALNDNPANPGSAAMILERQVYTDDENRVQTEFVCIKVFTEAGDKASK